jgi:NAD(P)H-hydrate repair Nnr-like enzyme with NAD(P)H-hydrate dehydratase domain
MSWLIVGTVPDESFPLVDARCRTNKSSLILGDHTVRIARGTPALLAAAAAVADVLGVTPPTAVLAGDIGRGDGSVLVYRHMIERLEKGQSELIVFHYLQPDIDWHNQLLLRIEESTERPLMVADAGYMYVAKMSGFSSSYDLFTPDAGEIAFLADESAPHPFYTRGFLLHEEARVPELIERAYANENASRYLLVKGRHDIVASQEGTIETISEPSVENMEPIGGTGDSLTGIVAGLLAGGRALPEAAILAARANRFLGLLTDPTPASSVTDLLPALPKALEMALSTSP